jgi:DNA-binding LacI/PurR family transcriptional regulator
MRDRVLAAAEQLGYQPNAIARGLITRRSNLVAVLTSARLNLYYPELLFRLTTRLAQEGLRVLLFPVDSEQEAGAVVEQVGQYQVDGVISVSHLSLTQYQWLQKRGLPVVFFNRYFVNHSVNVIVCDTSSQIAELIDRLVGYGHQHFGLIRGPHGNMVGDLRVAAVRTALARHMLEPACEADGDFTYDSGAEAIQALMHAGSVHPTAVICANDMMALGCIDEARTILELDVPGDLSVVGFDGITSGQFLSYDLTTIRQPIGRMCEEAVRLLLGRIEHPEQSNEKRVLEGAIIDGSTIAPVRHRRVVPA